jgi:UDP-N-acetylmuramoyl-tripeptide--D-alanyl-D-alanine ligase
VLCVDDCRDALGRLATAILAEARRRRGSLWTVGITGSNGKTTTKQMLAALLDDAHATPGNWNNHIGLPLTVAQLGPAHRNAVLEMGANQPSDIDELATIAPMNVAVVTSIGYAHTEGFGGIEGVRFAKAGIVRSGKAETAVLPVEEMGHPVWDDALAVAGCALVTFGTEASEADVRWHRPDPFGPVVLTSGGVLPSGTWTVACPLPGGHNASNLACAWAALLAGNPARIATTSATLSTRLATLQMPSGRLHRRVLAGRTVIDDAYNANPSSMRASLELLGQTVASVRVAILGDMLEIGEGEAQAHREMGTLAARVADIVWGVGPRGQWIAEAAATAGAAARAFATSADVAAALDTLPADATVLLKASRGIRLEAALAPWTDATEKA